MWYLDYWKQASSTKSSIKKEIRKITDKVRQQQLRKLVKLVEKFGPSLPMPNNKNLKGGLFELRDQTTGSRYYYCDTDFVTCESNKEEKKKRIILLLLVVGLEKDKQEKAIATARSRMKEVNIENILNEENFSIRSTKNGCFENSR